MAEDIRRARRMPVAKAVSTQVIGWSPSNVRGIPHKRSAPAKLNDVDPQAWLADVLARIADHPASRLDELLPWNWRPSHAGLFAAA